MPFGLYLDLYLKTLFQLSMPRMIARTEFKSGIAESNCTPTKEVAYPAKHARALLERLGRKRSVLVPICPLFGDAL